MTLLAALPPRETTVLAGAGVGVGAGAPAADGLVREIADALVLGSRWAGEVTSRVQPAGPLRFESAMDWLTEAADPDLAVLSFLDDLKPGPLHHTVADAAIRGARVLTTNFDDLIEQAIAVHGVTVRTLDTHSRSKTRATPGAVDVVKLHGTRRIHTRGTVAPSPRALHATISEIVSSGGGFGFPAGIHATVKRAVDRRTLVVLGYSGSDDLDVMPALHQCPPARVVWFAFTHHAPKVTRDFDAVNAGTAELLTAWRDRGTVVDVVVGHTARAVRHLGWTAPRAVPAHVLNRRASQRREHMRRWAEVAHENDPAGLAWVSLVLGELGLRRKAYQAAVASRPSTRPDGNWSVHRRLYEIAQNQYLLPNPDLDEVVRLAAEAAAAARDDHDYRSAAQSEILRARAYQLRDDLDGADTALDAAARDLRRERRGGGRGAHQEATHALWRGRVLLRRGEAKRAARAGATAADRARGVGDWSQQCEALRLVAQARYADDDLDTALPALEQAITIARRGPYADQLHYALSLQALIRLELGDPAAAIIPAREAAQLGVELRLFDEVSEALRTVGVCASELGLLHEARRAFALGLRHANVRTPDTFVADTVIGLAEVLVLTGRRAAARRLLADHGGIARGRPWDAARVAAIRWRLGDGTAAAADASLARALRVRAPFGQEAASIARLGRAGRAYDRLIAFVVDVLDGPEHEARRLRFLAWSRTA